MAKKEKLTELKIKNLPTPEKGQVRYWDELTGFHIRVSQGGTKTFAVLYGPQRRQIVIGRYPIISLAEARVEAHKILNSITLHKKPSVHFEMALTEHLEDKKTVLRASTYEEHARLLRRLKLRTTLDELTTSDCTKALNAISAPSERAHTYTALKTFLNWAVAREYCPKNALQSVPKPRTSTPRDRTLDDAEIAHLWTATHDLTDYNLIIRLLLLTGQRLNQIASLHQNWIKKDTIVFPGSIMKSGREHTIPKTPLVNFHLLQTVPGTSLFFRVPSWSAAKNRLHDTLPLDPWTHHDLRRTFSTAHAKLGTPPHITERLLDHQQGTLSPIAKIYNRYTYLPQMREAQENYERFILSTISLVNAA